KLVSWRLREGARSPGRKTRHGPLAIGRREAHARNRGPHAARRRPRVVVVPGRSRVRRQARRGIQALRRERARVHRLPHGLRPVDPGPRTPGGGRRGARGARARHHLLPRERAHREPGRRALPRGAVRRAGTLHADQLAAAIVEPFQRLSPPQRGFLEGLRTLTRRHGIPLIFDEVVTGFRFAYGGAQEYYGVVPDLAAYGKIIGGGFPLAAVCGRREIMRAFDPRLEGTPEFVAQVGTLSGNPIPAGAGLATLAELRKPGAC